MRKSGRARRVACHILLADHTSPLYKLFAVYTGRFAVPLGNVAPLQASVNMQRPPRLNEFEQGGIAHGNRDCEVVQP